MPQVRLPIVPVELGQHRISDDEQILGVLLLGCLSEVEAARVHDLPIDDHHLVVCDGVSAVDPGWNAGVN